jgi:ubiquinone/menaquinone biosynthesis C-methylase UbiE
MTSKKTGNYKFYNKVAKKFWNYSSHTYKVKREYLKGDPEKIFKQKLIKVSRKNKVALDVGCADGKFSLFMSSYFKKIIAIDLSQGMLNAGIKWQKEQKIKNVSFGRADAYKTKYKDKAFDVIYSRRGPSKFSEIFRLLKNEGYFVEIKIGEKDTQKIKEIFGRGQDFGDWKESRLKKHKKELEDTGFKVIFSQEYFYNEYYKTDKDLKTFLEGVPIFEDFDAKKDKKYLEKYTKLCKTKKGIKLLRHRLVFVAQKI